MSIGGVNVGSAVGDKEERIHVMGLENPLDGSAKRDREVALIVN